MKETILLYNLDSAAIRNKIKFLCIQGGIHIRVVEKNQYDVPIGTLAFGKKEDIEPYLRSENSEEKPSFNDPMLVFAGFTGQKLDKFFNAMRKQNFFFFFLFVLFFFFLFVLLMSFLFVFF